MVTAFFDVLAAQERLTLAEASQELSQAAGVLYMPLITEAGFMFGGAFGQGGP